LKIVTHAFKNLIITIQIDAGIRGVVVVLWHCATLVRVFDSRWGH
jgi:hypothetical protein